MATLLDNAHPCPLCGKNPELLWHAGKGVLPAKDKPEDNAKPIYGCLECGVFTRPAWEEIDALRGWQRGHYQ